MQNSPKILVYDIEVSDLRSRWGILLCVGYTYYGSGAVECPSVLDYSPEKGGFTRRDYGLVRDFIKIHNEADMVVTWYGKGFDAKWLNGKALEYGLPFLAPVPHVDLCFTAKANFKAGGNSLKNISEVAGFRASKTPLDCQTWRRAAVGEEPAIRNVIKHCIADVAMTAEAYERMRPLVRMHPRLGALGHCGTCGSERLVSKGKAVTKYKGEYNRFKCSDCGSWGQKPL